MPRQRRKIAGRPAMITGAASGIGRSLARLLSRTGSPVAIADIDETGLKETAQSLRGPVLVRVLDVADAADQARFAAEVREWLPAPLGAVFNNAGVAVAASVLDGDPGDDEWLRQINFGGVVNGTRAFLPILVEQDDGVIVNTSSVFGLVGMPSPERVLRGEVRGARLHRLAAPGTARHRRLRGERASRRDHHEHRAQRARPPRPRGPGPQPR